MAQQSSLTNARKVLVIRFSSIGDIVLTTPLIRCLKQQTGAEVHYLTKKKYTPLIAGNPYLDRVFSFEKNVQEVLLALKKERYDAVIDLHKNFRSFWVRWALGIQTYSFDKMNIRKWLLVNFKINRLPDVHIVNRYLAAAAPLGVQNDGKGLDFFIGNGELGIGNWWIKGLRKEVDSPYIAFAIGAAHQTKRLPTDYITAICREIRKPVILLGGKDEETEGAKIAEESGSHVFNSCGRLSLEESAACIGKAEKVITHDTGMMHIAAAFHREILSVWGSTVPAFGMYPYYGNNVDKNTTFEVENLPCRPCSKIGFDRCPKGHFHCMTKQNLAAIAAKANGE